MGMTRVLAGAILAETKATRVAGLTDWGGHVN